MQNDTAGDGAGWPTAGALGEWSELVDGQFQRVTRIDVPERGWRGTTHAHRPDKKGEGGDEHLNPTTPIPGEPKSGRLLPSDAAAAAQ